MNAAGKLVGKRIAVLAADGFEKAELVGPVAALRAAGAEVVIVGLHAGRIRGMNVHQAAELVLVDQTVNEANAADYDGLLIPGGYISPDLLRQSAQAREFVRQLDALGKPIAVLSQAPLVLASAGLAARRMLTSWPGVRDDLVNAGATWLNEDVVRDANWLSNQGAQAMAPLIAQLVPFFEGVAAGEPALARAQSDPQRQEPAETPGQPLRWLGTPSVGAMLSLALLGVGVVAANRGRRKKHEAGPHAPLP